MADDKKSGKDEKAKGEKAPKADKGEKAGAKGGAHDAKTAEAKAKGAEAKAKAAKDKGAKKDTAPAEGYKRTAPPRLKTIYQKEVVPRLMTEFKYTNPMQVPRLQKITVNMGLGEAVANPKILDSAVDELRTTARG
jgi:large subunit ribosomal protein L5